MTDSAELFETDSQILQGLRTEVTGLSDLFRRRLMEDRTKTAQFEALQGQLRASQELLASRSLEVLIKEVLLAVDRLQAEPPSLELNSSVADEIIEAFSRRSLAVIDDDVFDARYHEVVQTIAAQRPEDVGTIMAVHRRGYTLAGRLMRSAQVTIATGASPDARE